MTADSSRRLAEQRRRDHFALLRDAIGAHSGTVVKTLGDGVMASFTAAAAGVRCASAIQREIAARNDATRGQVLNIRIGLSAGDVDTAEADCHGLPVIEASRLCAAAHGGTTLAAEVVRTLCAGEGPFGERVEIELKGLPGPRAAYQIDWQPERNRPLRVVVAEDAALVREGIVRVLEDQGIEVVAQASDRDGLVAAVLRERPDAAVTDIRMPPLHSHEGLDAAREIRQRLPATGILLLSQHEEPGYGELEQAGVAYLLKERVADVDEFADAVRRVADRR